MESVDFANCYRGTFSQTDLPRIYAKATIILAVYSHAVSNNRYADPNKLRESLVFRRPLLTQSSTAFAHRAEAIGASLSVETFDVESINSALRQSTAFILSFNEKLPQMVQRYNANEVGSNLRQLRRVLASLHDRC
jgi:hypothetical protein